MSKVSLSGSVSVAGGCTSSCSGSSADRVTRSIAFRCLEELYQSATYADDLQIATAGAIGAEFVDLDVLQELDAIEFLYVRTDRQLRFRIGAEVAEVLGVGAAFGTVLNGETLTFDLDGVSIVATFVVPGDTTAAAIAARINAACALAGLATPRCTVDAASGQLRISGILTGAAGEVAITGGTAVAKLGLTGLTDTGAGADVDVDGPALITFPRFPNAPERIQVSGAGVITSIVAAGRSDV